MKLKLQVGHIYQRAGKPTDRNKPLPVVWDVLLFTDPHMGDITLHTEAVAHTPDGEKFAKWASGLKTNQIIEVDFPDQPKE